ncbi:MULTISPECIES: hypothetical protein [unclassified Pseudomonas]|uniref:hypothetical protein n=1 Tax=unclassified Pseudomonas TaxID=196821 RepID=UPI002449BB31|nr:MULTISPECIES: hypothetical protein [unclassified Pseudomonas]MDH0302806.1 hypothetical protein [Pseudomonas sp. GD04091]MDH1984381.1 hypothetical protein [Pseudomonas sp. GD03689]
MNQMVRKFPPPPIAFSDDQRSGIADDDLEGGKLTTFVNPYFDSAEGDTITLWVGSSQSEGEYLQPVFTVADPEARTEVSFPVEELRVVNDRRAYFGYKVNEGELSLLVGIDVAVS